MIVQEDVDKRKCVYANNTWMVIKRYTDQGKFFSVVRKYEKEFTKTFTDLISAIGFADTEV